MSRTSALVLAAVLIGLGILAFPLQNVQRPAVECAEPDGPTSGFVDDAEDCPISVESFEEIRQYETAPKPFRIVGLVLIVAGLGTGGYGLTRKDRPGARSTGDASG